MEGNVEAASLFMADNFLKDGKRGDSKQDEREIGEKVERITELDLELAAEIGKVLLEKNRELELLLRASQDYAEEQILKAQFFEQQAENLRDSLKSQSKALENLEAHNHELADQNTQLKNDCKVANSKNKRLWDTIESLEKKCENYKLKIDHLEAEENHVFEKGCEQENSRKCGCTHQKASHSDADLSADNDKEIHEELLAKCETLEEKMLAMQETITEMRVHMNMDSIEKDELKAEIEDLSTDNQLLQHRLSGLDIEIEEWQAFAKKAHKYKKLADRFSSDVDLSFTCSTSAISVPRLSQHVRDNDALQHSKLRVDNFVLSKASSHEVLSSSSAICDPSELLASKRHISSSVSQLNQPLKNLSVLSEMDDQYHDLVKRYEKLLSKYDDNHEGTAEEQSRTTHNRVQRAIQTLSWDFATSHTDTELVGNKCTRSPKREMTNLQNTMTNDDAVCDDDDDDYAHLDFRKMFVEIFAKLKATKDFDPESKVQSSDSE
eukprot:gene9330-10314_t